MDLFINNVEERGRVLQWNNSDYAIATAMHLQGNPRREFLKNKDWESLTWKEVQRDLRTAQLRNENSFMNNVKKWFNWN